MGCATAIIVPRRACITYRDLQQGRAFVGSEVGKKDLFKGTAISWPHRAGAGGMLEPCYPSHAVGGCTMRYLRVVVLLLAVTFVAQACIFVPVPVGGGGGHHRRHYDDWR
jgi:hypothetical protein